MAGAAVRAAFEFAHWSNEHFSSEADWSDELEPAAALAWEGEQSVADWVRVDRVNKVRIVEEALAGLRINVGDVNPQVRALARGRLRAGVEAYLDSPDHLLKMIEFDEITRRNDETRRRADEGGAGTG